MSRALVFFVRVMLARAYPRVIALKRHPGWLLMETVLPILSVSAFALVYRAMHAPEEYLGFAILGGAVTAFWLNVIWSMGAQFYWDREAGNLELFLAAPASLMAILAGMALGFAGYFGGFAAFLLVAVLGAIGFAVGWLLDADVRLGDLGDLLRRRDRRR